MSIESEITRLQGVKSDILQAISDKGVVVPAGSALDDCPGLIASISGAVSSFNLSDYDYVDLIDDIKFLNGFTRRGTKNEFVRYYKSLGILVINLFCKKSSAITASDWVDVFTLTNSDFYFSDFADPSQQPVGVLGINSGTMLTTGIDDSASTNKNILLTTLTTGDGRVAYKDILLQASNFGVVINRCYAVVPKHST